MVPETDETLTILRNTSRPSSRSRLAGSRRCGAAARMRRDGATRGMASLRWNPAALILWVGEHRVSLVVAHLVDGRAERVAGVVDDDVDPAPRVDRRLDERVGHAVLRQVAGVDGRLAADLVRRLLRQVPVEVVDHDLGAVLGEQLGRRAADAPGAAGDDRDLVVEDSHPFSLCSLCWRAGMVIDSSVNLVGAARCGTRRGPAGFRLNRRRYSSHPAVY